MDKIAVQMHTSKVILALEEEIAYRMSENRQMSVIGALAFASGYAGHDGVDLIRIFKRVEQMWFDGMLTSKEENW